MKLDFQKEPAAVFYGSRGIKLLRLIHRPPNSRCFPMHWNDHVEILRIHSGSMLLELGEKLITVPAGHLAIVNHKQPHGATAGPEGLCYSAALFDISSFINQTQASKQMLSPLLSGSAVFSNITNEPTLLEITDQLIHQYQDNAPYSALILQGKVYELLGQMYQHCLLPAIPLAVCDHRFQNVLDYVNQNYCKELHSADLSKQYGYDNAYFCRRFKAVTGLTLTHYLRVLRLEHAQQLMKNPQASLREIAALCGFTDAGYFSRCFRDYCGLTPSAFTAMQNRSGETSYHE